MKNSEIQVVEKIAKEAWRNDENDLVPFDSWWSVQLAKLKAQQSFFKAGIKSIINSTVGNLDMSIEAGSERYWDNLPPSTDMADPETIKNAFVEGSKSDEARKMWYAQFLFDEYLKEQ